MPPRSSEEKYCKYRVVKEFEVVEGRTVAWFDEPGGGRQLYGVTADGKKLTIEYLLEEGFLVEVR